MKNNEKILFWILLISVIMAIANFVFIKVLSNSPCIKYVNRDLRDMPLSCCTIYNSKEFCEGFK